MEERSSQADQNVLPPAKGRSLADSVSAHAVENDGNMPASKETHRESMSEFVNKDGDNSCCHEEKNRQKVF